MKLVNVLLLLAFGLALVPLSVATYSIFCSGGGTRAALGCGLGVTLLMQQDPTFRGEVRSIKGVSGGAWGVAMVGLASRPAVIRAKTRKQASKDSQFGPQVGGLRITSNFYNNWKKQIRKYFISPYAKSVKTLNDFANRVGPRFPNIDFQIIVAGVDHQKYAAPSGWCAFSTTSVDIKCFDATNANTLKWQHGAATQKMSQILSLTSSAASTMKVPKLLRKFPTFDVGTGVPYKYLVDAGHFNNQPFVPLPNDNKIITFEYSDTANPLSCYVRFNTWAKAHMATEELDTNVLVLLRDGSFDKSDLNTKPSDDGILFVFRTKTHARYYYNIPFVGLNLRTTLLSKFPTMTGTFGQTIKDYTREEVDLFIDEYFECLLEYLPLLMRTIKADPTTLPWPTRAVTMDLLTLTDSDEYTDFEPLDFYTDKSSDVSSYDEYDNAEEDEDDFFIEVAEELWNDESVLQTNEVIH